MPPERRFRARGRSVWGKGSTIPAKSETLPKAHCSFQGTLGPVSDGGAAGGTFGAVTGAIGVGGGRRPRDREARRTSRRITVTAARIPINAHAVVLMPGVGAVGIDASETLSSLVRALETLTLLK